MKKNIYLAIITIITIVCIVFGSIMHLNLFNLPLPSFKIISSDWKSASSEKDAGSSMNDTASLDQFSAIKVDCNVMTTKIVSGDSFKIALDCNEKLMPTYSVKNNTLTIKQQTKRNNFTGNNHANMVITVPAGTALKRLDIKQNVGEFSTKDISFDEADIVVNVGDVTLTNATANNISIDVNTGDIDINSCDFTTVDIRNDVGDVEYVSANGIADYALELSTDIGDLEIDGTSAKKDGKMSRSFSQKGSAGSITIKSDIGDVEVK